jgi:repressor LexA
MKELTQRQIEVLEFIKESIRTKGFPPTIRETAGNFAISVKGAHDHIRALIKKGQLRQENTRSRALRLVETGEEPEDLLEYIEVPFKGVAAAGLPPAAEKIAQDTIRVDKRFLPGRKQYFALRVRGESMTGAGIMDGDVVIIEQQDTAENGQIVAAMSGESMTLKRIFKQAHRVLLRSENPAFDDISTKDPRILGRLVYSCRRY